MFTQHERICLIFLRITSGKLSPEPLAALASLVPEENRKIRSQSILSSYYNIIQYYCTGKVDGIPSQVFLSLFVWLFV